MNDRELRSSMHVSRLFTYYDPIYYAYYLSIAAALVAKIVGGQQAEVEPTSGAGMKSA